MAMLHLGMGDTTGVGTPATTMAHPTGVDQFLGGAKVWLSPSTVPATLSDLWARVKSEPVATLTNPGVLGFLLVPAAILAVVLGMGAAGRRRTRNPRRRVAYARRRVRNPRHSGGTRWSLRKGGWAKWGKTGDFVKVGSVNRRAGTARVRTPDGEQVTVSIGTLHAAYSPVRNPRRRAVRGRRGNPGHLLGKNRRFMAVTYGSQGGNKYWGVYDYQAHKFVSPATRNYKAQVKLAARMERDEPGYGVQKKAMSRARQIIVREANPVLSRGDWVVWETKPGGSRMPVAFGPKTKLVTKARQMARAWPRSKFVVSQSGTSPARKTNPRHKSSGANPQYEVVVGNVGTVYMGRQGFQAHLDYNRYVGISKNGGGKAAGEPVTLFKDGEIVKEYQGTVRNPSRRITKKSKTYHRSKRVTKRFESRSAGKRSRSRGTHRVKNGRSYVLRGSMPAPSYTPGPGKKFTLSGRTGTVKSVVMDGNSKWVNFRRSVDGTSGMSLANFRQAARIE